MTKVRPALKLNEDQIVDAAELLTIAERTRIVNRLITLDRPARRRRVIQAARRKNGQTRARLLSTLREVQEANRDVPPEQIEAEIAEAVAAVRAK
jgi:NADH:ubiquinone oxidoreductase subunit E